MGGREGEERGGMGWGNGWGEGIGGSGRDRGWGRGGGERERERERRDGGEGIDGRRRDGGGLGADRKAIRRNEEEECREDAGLVFQFEASSLPEAMPSMDLRRAKRTAC